MIPSCYLQQWYKVFFITRFINVLKKWSGKKINNSTSSYGGATGVTRGGGSRKRDLSMGNVEKAFGEHPNLGSRLHLYKEGETPT